MVQVKLDASFCKAAQPWSKTLEYAEVDRSYKGIRLVVSRTGDKAFAFRSTPFYTTIDPVGQLTQKLPSATRKQLIVTLSMNQTSDYQN